MGFSRCTGLWFRVHWNGLHGIFKVYGFVVYYVSLGSSCCLHHAHAFFGIGRWCITVLSAIFQIMMAGQELEVGL